MYLQADITIFVINSYAGRLQTGKQSVGRFCLSYYLPKIMRRYENSFKRFTRVQLITSNLPYLLRNECFHRQFKYLFLQIRGGCLLGVSYYKRASEY